MKDYLNKQEANDFLLIGYINDTLEKIKKEWSERNFLTKEEATAIKYTQTYLSKFYKSVFDRMNPGFTEEMLKKLKKFEFRFLDDYTMQQIMRDASNRMQNAVVPRPQFDDFCEQIINHNCENCTKHFSQCDLYKLFHDNFVEESSWGLENCPYAYRPVNGESNKDARRKYDIYKKRVM